MLLFRHGGVFILSSFCNKDFQLSIEKYLTDQVPLRDGWVTMKTYMELATGKRESGGVYICKDKYLMTKFTSYSKKQLAANAAALADLQEKLAAEGVSMNTILVSMAAQGLTDKLPAYAPVADYREMIFGDTCEELELSSIGGIIGITKAAGFVDSDEGKMDISIETRVPPAHTIGKPRKALRMKECQMTTLLYLRLLGNKC